MNENYVSDNCEGNCFFFEALPEFNQTLSRWAREAKYEEFPGLLNTMCGTCLFSRKNHSYLEEQTRKLQRYSSKNSTY